MLAREKEQFPGGRLLTSQTVASEEQRINKCWRKRVQQEFSSVGPTGEKATEAAEVK